MRSVLFVAPLLVASTYGESCTSADTSLCFQSLMQGFQSDTTATDTQCYGKVELFNNKVTILSTTLQSFGTDAAQNPAEAVYNLSDITVASTDVFTYCQTTDLAK